MKLAFNISLLLFVLLIFSNESFSLTDYEIKRICKKEKRELNCIKKLLEKRSNLNKGNAIEIPVIPHKR